MGTPMAPNYGNLFKDNFEQNLLRDYFQKKLDYRGSVLLTMFSSHGSVTRTRWIFSFHFTQNYSKFKNMKSKIKSKIQKHYFLNLQILTSI